MCYRCNGKKLLLKASDLCAAVRISKPRAPRHKVKPWNRQFFGFLNNQKQKKTKKLLLWNSLGGSQKIASMACSLYDTFNDGSLRKRVWDRMQ